MDTDSIDIAARMSHYEGLVRKTTSMYHERFNEPFEDFAQVLRVKVIEALRSYDPSKSKMTEEKYVFSCVKNRVNDFLRKVQVRNEAGWKRPAFIEDIAQVDKGHDEGPRDAFDAKYLSTDEEQAFQDLLAEVPLIPTTLDAEEKRIVTLLYVGFNQVEVAKQLGLTRTEAIEAVKQIRIKLVDWSPAPLQELEAARSNGNGHVQRQQEQLA